MPQRPDPKPFENPCNASAIRRASRRITQFYDSALEPSGLRSTQFSILYHVVRAAKTPMTIGELAAALVLDRSALGHNLRPLLRDGLVALREPGEDRRQSRVVATPAGRAKYREARKLWQRAQDRFEASIGRTKAAALRKTLFGIAHSEALTVSLTV